MRWHRRLIAGFAALCVIAVLLCSIWYMLRTTWSPDPETTLDESASKVLAQQEEQRLQRRTRRFALQYDPYPLAEVPWVRNPADPETLSIDRAVLPWSRGARWPARVFVPEAYAPHLHVKRSPQTPDAVFLAMAASPWERPLPDYHVTAEAIRAARSADGGYGTAHVPPIPLRRDLKRLGAAAVPLAVVPWCREASDLVPIPVPMADVPSRSAWKRAEKAPR